MPEDGMIHFPMFVATLITFGVTAVISFIFQLKATQTPISLTRFINHCFPPIIWREKSTLIDIIMYVASKFLDKLFFFTGLLAVLVSLFIQDILSKVIPVGAAYEVGFFTIGICSIVLFLVGDFANFLTHYLQHFVPALWEFHKVHHSATFLNPLTTKRMHPLGDAFDKSVSALLQGIVMGVFSHFYALQVPHLLILMANANLVGTIMVLDSLRHSHFPVSFGMMDHIVLSPHMHQLHHCSKIENWDKNFGNKLSIWDFLFRTAKVPVKGEEFRYGLGTDENKDYNSLTGIYVGPLIKFFMLVVGMKGKEFSKGAYDQQSSTDKKSFYKRVVWRSPKSQIRI